MTNQTTQPVDHDLKTDPEVFDAVQRGDKTFEIRFNDRGFKVGDKLHMLKTVHTGAEMKAGAPLVYTCDEIVKTVSHVLTGYGLADGWCCLSFAPEIPAPEGGPELRDAAQHALATLDQLAKLVRDRSVIDNLRAALAAQPNDEPVGWFEGPHGAFRANPAVKMDWPPQSLQWQVPVYLRAAQPQADDWRRYATEREDTAQQVIERHRAEHESLLRLLAADRKTIEELRAVQAPAEGGAARPGLLQTIKDAHDECLGGEHHSCRSMLRDVIAELEADKPQPKGTLTVWYGSMPESNGKSNWTAILHRGDLSEGHTLDRSEYPDRVRYEADRVRWLIGELADQPFILDYDDKLHSGYVAPASVPCAAAGASTHELQAHIRSLSREAWEWSKALEAVTAGVQQITAERDALKAAIAVKRAPLTPGQVDALASESGHMSGSAESSAFIDGLRLGERAHGITASQAPAVGDELQGLSEREAFEAEMRCEEKWGHKSLKRSDKGTYLNSWTAVMWEVWQARATLTPAQAQAALHKAATRALAVLDRVREWEHRGDSVEEAFDAAEGAGSWSNLSIQLLVALGTARADSHVPVRQVESELVELKGGAMHGLDPAVAKAFGARPVTAAEMRQAAAHDTSCVGAFARARPGAKP